MPQPILFTPLKLRGLTIPNRVVVAPMCQYSATDGLAGDWHHQHYGALAASGPGMIVLEATGVTPEGRISATDLGLWDDATEQALTRLVSMMKTFGNSTVAVQLQHAGRKASTARLWEGGAPTGGWQTIAPSAVPFGEGGPTPREMTRTDMDEVRDAFAAAARRARRVGFDAIEVHSAHGYLLHQFLSPLANRRGDDYGGSLDNRMRFPLEVIATLRAAWPTNKPLGVRVSVTDWLDGGFTLDEAVVFAKAFATLGVDYICVTSGGIVGQAPIPIGPGYQVALADRIRSETGLVTRAVGLIVDPSQAESVLTEGRADMVALGRAFLDNPRWTWHAAEALGAETFIPPQYGRAARKVWSGAECVMPALVAMARWPRWTALTSAGMSARRIRRRTARTAA